MPLKIIHDFALQQGYSKTELIAAEEAHARKSRKSHPKGRFDKACRFTLEERQACCQKIRTPSHAYPHSEMLHGRSLLHVAHLYDVPKLHVQRLAKAFDAAKSAQESRDTNHAKVQLLIKLRHILKPVHPAR